KGEQSQAGGPGGNFRHRLIVEWTSRHAQDPVQMFLSAAHSLALRKGEGDIVAADLLIAAMRAFVSGWSIRIFMPGSGGTPIFASMVARPRASPPALFMRSAP